MYVILSVVLVMIGAFMAFAPRGFYEVTEKWKTTSNTEPSDLFLFSTRFGGVFFLLAGIAGLAVFLLL